MPKMKDVTPVNQPRPQPTKIITVKQSTEHAATVEMKMPSQSVYHNSHFLVWPTDKWGFTKDLKKALIRTASKINGQADKKALFDAVMEVGMKHIEAKYADKLAHTAKTSTDSKKDGE